MTKILLTILFLALIGLLFYSIWMVYSLFRELKNDQKKKTINKNKEKDE